MADYMGLQWDQTGERFWETGVDRGAIYPQAADGTYPAGYAWNGLTGVTDSPSGAEPTDLWADNIKYATLRSTETSGGTIEAYTYPDAFAECNGEKQLIPGVRVGQQPRKNFGFTYRTKIGDDTSPNPTAYKIHLVYGASVNPSEKSYQTVNDSPEAITMSWEYTTTPVTVTGFDPTATLEIDSRTVEPTKLAAFEKALYGDATTAARLPLPDEVKTLLT